MDSKLQAVKRAVDVGIDTVIMNGAHLERVLDVVAVSYTHLTLPTKA